jgi:hypothetical protein
MFCKWVSLAVHPQNVKIKIAVNTQAQREILGEFGDVMVTGDDRPGAAYPSYCLTQSVWGLAATDVVILATDDMQPPKSWDAWVLEQFEGFDGCLMVNDGYQTGECVTLPIMTYSCLLRLNKIIFHPAYSHNFVDSELYDVCSGLGLLKNLRGPDQPIFEHVHWAAGKRATDEHDDRVKVLFWADKEKYLNRKSLPIVERLKA